MTLIKLNLLRNDLSKINFDLPTVTVMQRLCSNRMRIYGIKNNKI